MARPLKPRKIFFDPDVTYFKPRAIPLNLLEEVEVGLDELQIIKFCDYEGLGQTEAAEKMNISQSTLQRILTSGRKKIAEALVEGKAIKINNNKNNN
jgi:predicted DNA-binding protein (UPF0251 family)